MSSENSGESDILYVGDPHGRFDLIRDRILSRSPKFVVLLGDMDLDRPLDEEMAPVIDKGIEVYWISGNHDVDNSKRYDFLYGSELSENDLSGRVVDMGGIRVAGLGGIFKGRIWFPKETGDEPAFCRSRAEYIDSLTFQERWRQGIPLRHRVAIFPEDFDRLSSQQADVLVSHEAPSFLRKGETMLGFKAIDQLAIAMQVSMIVHGHHHTHYDAFDPVSGIRCVGLAKAQTSALMPPHTMSSKKEVAEEDAEESWNPRPF